jgi:hypothetical protein
MDVNRLRLGEMVAAAGAAVLFLVMFLDWYGVEGTSVAANAWQVFSWVDLYLFLTVVVALGLAVLTMGQRTVALPLSVSVLVTAMGAVATLLILYRIVNQPGPNELISVQIGAYLGLLAALAITVGGYLSMRDENASFGSAATRLQSQSQTPTRPPPPPGPEAAGPPAEPAPAGATQVSPRPDDATRVQEQPGPPPEGGPGAPPAAPS